MKKLTVLTITALCLSGLNLPAALQLAQDRKTNYAIVYTDKEKEASEELKYHLDRITGADFPLIPETKASKLSRPAFYVGNTGKAKRVLRIKPEKLGPEEWYVKTVGPDVIITGGKTRGTLYGVYELLEKKFGCRWLAYDTNIIPPQTKLVLEETELRGTPSFTDRDIADDLFFCKTRGKEVYQKNLTFHKRVRASLESIWPKKTRQYYSCHNIYYFVEPSKYYKTHPEYFDMNAAGKRVHGTVGANHLQGNNICYSNPAVVEITWKKLEEYIAKDRKKLPPDQWPTVYNITHMDRTSWFCQCPECRKIAKREGGDCGLLLYFYNQIAERLEKKYPELFLDTFMFGDPPKTIRPKKNIRMRWIYQFSYSDCYRPITHPLNLEQKKKFDAWVRTGAKVSVYEYWNLGSYFNPLRVETCIDRIGPNLKYFHQNGARIYFCEFQSDKDRQFIQNFAFLQVYLGYQLLKDVRQDPEQIIQDFMNGFYGPAAKPMSEFLEMLRKGIRGEKTMLTNMSGFRSYCTEAFLREAWSKLEKAHALTQPGTLYRAHVEYEMMCPIYEILKNHWNIGNYEWMYNLYKTTRLRRNNESKVPPGKRKQILAKLQAELYSFTKLDLKVPEQFRERYKGREIHMFGWPWMRGGGTRHSAERFVDDPEAAGGKALLALKTFREKNDMVPLFDMKQTKRKGWTPLDFGTYDRTPGIRSKHLHRSFAKAKLPTDEKYHWYELGQFEMGPATVVWGFYQHNVCHVSTLYRPGKSDRYTAWVSAKFTGPAYVPGSTKENNIYWDQVVLVRTDTPVSGK